MELGTFSVSLAVKDIAASRAFYEALGFEVFAGEQEQRWLILRSGDAKIGLFQGMFEGNVLTFNPPDVRAVQATLKERGIALMQAAQGDSGPGHATLVDPDGNAILLDQF